MRKVILSVLALAAVAGFAMAQGPAYFMSADTVRGAKNATGPSCVLTSAYKTGEQIVWRAVIYDAATGEQLTEQQVKDRGVKAQVKLEDGTTIDMEYGLHPKEPPQIWLWVGAWVVPPVYPTGMLKYDITVTDDAGNSYTWAPIGQDREGGYSSLITVEKR